MLILHSPYCFGFEGRVEDAKEDLAKKAEGDRAVKNEEEKGKFIDGCLILEVIAPVFIVRRNRRSHFRDCSN